jgi:hypothetical protein
VPVRHAGPPEFRLAVYFPGHLGISTVRASNVAAFQTAVRAPDRSRTSCVENGMSKRLALLLLFFTACTESFATPDSPSPTQQKPPGASRPIVAGTDCNGRGVVVTNHTKRPFTRDGTIWKREEGWGCGCPTRPVWTMVYEPKTNPLRVRLCKDQRADSCEMACRSVLSWDLAQPLREAGASDIQPVD